MKFEDRKRELLQKPPVHGGPCNGTKEYFNNIHFKDFRRNHKDFDEYLIEVSKLIKLENNKDFDNIVRFLNYDGETNWICTKISLFAIFIKLYNLCLSPKQTVEYIKECLSLYKRLCNTSYKLIERPIFITKASDPNIIESIEFTVRPTVVDNDYRYRFVIKMPAQFYNDNFNYIGCHLRAYKIDAEDARLYDCMKLFEYHQKDKDLIKRVFYIGLNELLQRKYILEHKETKLNLSGYHLFEPNLILNRNKRLTDAIMLCNDLGYQFINNFNNVYQNPNYKSLNVLIEEMQKWFDEISHITLSTGGFYLDRTSINDWFLTVGLTPKKYLDDDRKVKTYDDFCNHLLITKDVKKSLINAKVIDC